MKTTATARVAALVLMASGLALTTASCSFISDVVDSAAEVVETTAAESVTEDTPSVEPADDTADVDLAAQEAALETYITAAQAQVPVFMESFGDTYADFQINGYYPDTMEYAYWYLSPVDPVEAQAYFDGQISLFQEIADSQVFPEMNSYGITVGPKVMYTYYNADGTLLWSYTFEQS